MAILKFKDRVNSEDRYIVSTAGQGATITGADAGDNDVVAIDGLAGSYMVRASGSKLLIQGVNDAGKKFLVTVNFNAKTAGEVTVAFRDGSVTFDYTPKVGKVKASIKMVGDESGEGAPPVTVTTRAFVVPVTVVNKSYTAEDAKQGLSVPRDDDGNIIFSMEGGTLELTTGTDNLKGAAGDDVVLATRQTLTAFDKVDGLGGADTMLVESDGNLVIPISAKISSIETVAIVSAGSVTGQLTSNSNTLGGFWSGIETLTIEANGAVDILTDAAAVTVTTAAGDDDIAVEAYDISTVAIRAGEGDNTIDLDLDFYNSKEARVSASTEGSVLIVTGAGDDEISVDAEGASSVVIQAGSGDNTIDLNLDYSGNVDISAGSGDNDISIFYSDDVTIKTGAGADSIELIGANDVDLQVGEGNNSIDIRYVESASIKAGSGDDSIAISRSYDYESDGFYIDAGAGNNSIEITDSESDTYISTGAGNDTIVMNYVEDVEAEVGAGNNSVELNHVDDVYLEAGAGDDTVEVTDADYVDIDVGAGNNSIAVDDANNVYVQSDAGNDTIVIDDINYGVYISAGDGNNSIDIDYADYVSVESGSGDDAILITDASYGFVSSGAGDDTIELVNSFFYSDEYWGSGGSINAGDGDDSVTIGVSVSSEGFAGNAVNNIDLGTGENTLVLNITNIDNEPLDAVAAAGLAYQLSTELGGNLNHLTLNTAIDIGDSSFELGLEPASDEGRLMSLTVGDLSGTGSVELSGVATDFTLASTGSIGTLEATSFDDAFGQQLPEGPDLLDLLVSNDTATDDPVPQTLTVSAVDDLSIGLASVDNIGLLQDVTLSAGENAYVEIDVVALESASSLGNVSLTGGDTAVLSLLSLNLSRSESESPVTLTVGNVAVSSDVAAGVVLDTFMPGSDDSVAVYGDVTVTGGTQAVFSSYGYGTSLSVELGNIELETSDAPSSADSAVFQGMESSDASAGLFLFAENELNASIESLAIDSAGSAEAVLSFAVDSEADANITLGTLDVIAVSDASLELSASLDYESISTSDSDISLASAAITVTSEAGEANLSVYADADYSDYSDITMDLGAVAVSGAEAASAYISLELYDSESSGIDLTAGDVTITSDNGQAQLDVFVDVEYAYSVDASLDLANVSLSGATASLELDDWDLDASYGDGHLTVSVGDVSITATGSPTYLNTFEGVYESPLQSASFALADMDADYMAVTIDLGKVTMTAAAGAEFIISDLQAYLGSITVSAGDITLTTGQDANVYIENEDSDVHLSVGNITVTAEDHAAISVDNNEASSLAGNILVSADTYSLELGEVYGVETIDLTSTSNLVNGSNDSSPNTVDLSNVYDLKTLTLEGKSVDIELFGEFNELDTIDLSAVSTDFSLDLSDSDIGSIGEALFINVGVSDGSIELSSSASQDVILFAAGEEALVTDIGSLLIENFNFGSGSTADYIDLSAFGFENSDVIVTTYNGLEGNGYFIDFVDLSLGAITVVGTGSGNDFLLGVDPIMPISV